MKLDKEFLLYNIEELENFYDCTKPQHPSRVDVYHFKNIFFSLEGQFKRIKDIKHREDKKSAKLRKRFNIYTSSKKRIFLNFLVPRIKPSNKRKKLKFRKLTNKTNNRKR